MRSSALARGAGVLAAAGAFTAVGSRLLGRSLVGRAEARLCPTSAAPPPAVSPAARELHRRLLVADLHADSLLWGRDLLRRSDRGQVDVPSAGACPLATAAER